MFDVGLPEIAVLIIAALFVFGPDRLPTVVAQAARTIRQIRNLAAGARAEINDAIGPELRDFNALAGLGELGGLRDEFKDIRDLNPRKILNNAMFGADDKMTDPAGTPAVEPTTAAQGVAAGTDPTGTDPTSTDLTSTDLTSTAPSGPPAVFDADAT